MTTTALPPAASLLHHAATSLIPRPSSPLVGSSSTTSSASEQYAAARGHALLLPSRQARRMAVRQIDEVECGKGFPCSRFQRIVDAPPEHHLVCDATGVELVVGVLHHEVAQTPPLSRGERRPVPRHAPLLLASRAHQDLRERRLPGSVRTAHDRDAPQGELGVDLADAAPRRWIDEGDALEPPCGKAGLRLAFARNRHIRMAQAEPRGIR